MMSATVLFEHPLNEKVRTWLRIELLLEQLNNGRKITNYLSAITFFRHASDLLDMIERSEPRTEIAKELEKQQQKLLNWRNVSGVDSARVTALYEKLKNCVRRLLAAPRTGQLLRDDRLLSLVRQRLSLPGSYCSFDLPTLHFWLHLDQQHRDCQVEHWLASLAPLQEALSMLLMLIRQSGIFRAQYSVNGFFQGNTENTELLRLQLRMEDSLYPQISGHKNRYAIRFLPFDSEFAEVPPRIEFNLACC